MPRLEAVISAALQLARAAVEHDDNVGLMVFADTVQRYVAAGARAPGAPGGARRPGRTRRAGWSSPTIRPPSAISPRTTGSAR